MTNDPNNDDSKAIDAKVAVQTAMKLFRDLQVGEYTDLFLEGIDVPSDSNPEWAITIGFTPVSGHSPLRKVFEPFGGAVPPRGAWRLRTTVVLERTGELKRMSPSQPYAPV